MKSKKSKLSAIVFFSVIFVLVSVFANIAFAQQWGDYTYEVSDGTVTITKYTGAGGSVVIPSAINGMPVVGIGDYAFEDFGGLTSVTIPDCVISIGIGAFQYCSGLTSVTIPDSVTIIGHLAFYNCDHLTSVTIPDSVTIIGHLAFYNCDHLTSVIIPESVTSIGDAAFDQCSSLTSVTIPNSVTSIGACAFYRCIGLTSVTIGNGVTSIGYGAFYECTTLTKAYFLGNAPRMEMGFFIVGYSYVHYGVFDYCANNFTVCYTAGSKGFTFPKWYGYPARGCVDSQCAAEAIYGEDSDQTELLREYRDKVLSKTPEGQELIKTYYQFSPAVTKLLEQRPLLKNRAKAFIDSILPAIREKVNESNKGAP